LIENVVLEGALLSEGIVLAVMFDIQVNPPMITEKKVLRLRIE
jgi:hypothetical protein